MNNNHIVETSLEYYINPLVSVLLGIIVLKEKLSLWQMVSFECVFVDEEHRARRRNLDPGKEEEKADPNEKVLKAK